MSAYNETTVAERALTTDAHFRAWVAAIHTCLAAAGLVKTTETGEINTGTVTIPATSNYGGFSVWRFDDAEQATTPVYIKFEFGIGSIAGRHAVRVTVGEGTDGAGTLTNPSTASAGAVGSTPSTGTGTEIASFFDGAFYFTDYLGNATGRAEIIVERLRDIEGEFTGEIAFGASVSTGNVPSFLVLGEGAWEGWNAWTYDIINHGLHVSGKAIFGGIRFQRFPRRMLRAMLICSTVSVSTGDSGTVDDGLDSMTYKRHSVATQTEGSNAGPINRSA